MIRVSFGDPNVPGVSFGDDQHGCTHVGGAAVRRAGTGPGVVSAIVPS